MRLAAEKVPTGIDVPVEVSVSARAKRLSLRVDAVKGIVKVTVPVGVSPRQAQEFVARYAGWIRARLATLPDRIPFTVGTTIPVLGVDHRIRQDLNGPRLVRFETGADGPEIVLGRAEFVESRVRDFLKAEAKRLLTERSHEMAGRIGKKVRAVSVKDTTSRWGSCTSAGDIAYSWRMILTPREIFDYLVAHEVSHLEHMNHSPAFWRTCAGLSPISPERARAWLKRNSQRLLLYGPAEPAAA